MDKRTQLLVQMNKSRSFSDEVVFVENSTHPRHRVKDRLISRSLVPYVCKECGTGPEWNGKELVLQLEHLNGVNDDNRIENLAFLCPNCHSQTITYAARNRKNPNRKPKPNAKY